MRTHAEDVEVTERLREFDHAALRLLALEITPKHLRDRVREIERGFTPATNEEQRHA